MQNLKVYAVIQQFTKVEQNRFRKFLCSPYFNANQDLIDLYDHLVDSMAGDPEQEVPKEAFWEKLNPDKPYDDVRMRKYFSDLLKQLEGYIAQEAFQENPLHQATYLMDAVIQRKISKLFNNTLKSARRLSDQQHYRPANYYYHQYQIEKNYYRLNRSLGKRDIETNVEEIANNLDRFYLAEKLKYYCDVLSQQYSVSFEYEILFLEEIIAHIKRYRYEEVPPIAVYFQIYLAYTEGDNEAHYFKLKDLLEKHGLEFPKEEAQEIYTFAINYCTRKINKGNQSFLREYFDLYKDLLKKDILIVEGEMEPGLFRNIVVVGLRLGEMVWTEQFILDYQHYLPEAQRENTVSFNLSQLYFYKRDYDMVIETLRHVEYEDVITNLNAKTLLLTTYFEIDEIEPLYSLMESFRAYLNRHKDISSRRRRSFLQFIRFVKKLTKTMPGDSKRIESLREELKSSKGVASSQWIMEKIEELV
ncbi:MAG: hypothetical protein IPJ40_05210 [Saprospirales bacterium]|nr:hypothetical protein [Saprospirales bacterium]